MSIFTSQHAGLGASCFAFMENETYEPKFCNDVGAFECPYSEAPATLDVPLLLAGGQNGFVFHRNFFRFPSVNIPRSSYINSASLKLWIPSVWISGTVRAYVENANNPTMPTDYNTCRARGLSTISDFEPNFRLCPHESYAAYNDGTFRDGLETTTILLASGAELPLAQIVLNVTECFQYAISSRWWDRYDAINIILSDSTQVSVFYYAGYSASRPELAPLLTVDHDNMAVKIQVGADITVDLEHNHPEINEVVTAVDRAITNWPNEGEIAYAFTDLRAGFQWDITESEVVAATVTATAGFEDRAVVPITAVASVEVTAQFELIFEFDVAFNPIETEFSLATSLMLNTELSRITGVFEYSNDQLQLTPTFEQLTFSFELGKAFGGELANLTGDFVYLAPDLSFAMVDTLLPELTGAFALGNTLELTLAPVLSVFTLSTEKLFTLAGELAAPSFAGELMCEVVYNLAASTSSIKGAFEQVTEVQLVLVGVLAPVVSALTLFEQRDDGDWTLRSYTQAMTGNFSFTTDAELTLNAAFEPLQVIVSFWSDYFNDPDEEVLRYKDRL